MIIILLLSVCYTSFSNELEIERLHYEERLTQTTSIIVVNKLGDIRIRQTDDDNFIYHAVSQYTKAFKAKLKVDRKDDVLTLSLDYPNMEKEKSPERVDIAIIIPKNIKIIIEIDKGNLSSKKLDNEITVNSENSDISLKSFQPVNLFSKHGNIDFTLLSNKSKDDSRIKTFNGEVNLYFHSNNIPSVDVLTGGITTTNSMKVLKTKSLSKRKVLYKQKDSLDNVHIQTDSGSIRIVEIEKIKKELENEKKE